MRIAVTATSIDAGAAPLHRVFENAGCDDEVLAASAAKVKDTLARGMRINVNDALLMFAAYVALSVRDGKDAGRTAGDARAMLGPHNVMIGVPEMLHAMRFEVLMDGRASRVSIDRPIEAAGGDLWPGPGAGLVHLKLTQT